MPCTYQHTKVPQWTNNVRPPQPWRLRPASSCAGAVIAGAASTEPAICAAWPGTAAQHPAAALAAAAAAPQLTPQASPAASPAASRALWSILRCAGDRGLHEEAQGPEQAVQVHRCAASQPATGLRAHHLLMRMRGAHTSAACYPRAHAAASEHIHAHACTCTRTCDMLGHMLRRCDMPSAACACVAQHQRPRQGYARLQGVRRTRLTRLSRGPCARACAVTSVVMQKNGAGTPTPTPTLIRSCRRWALSSQSPRRTPGRSTPASEEHPRASPAGVVGGRCPGRRRRWPRGPRPRDHAATTALTAPRHILARH